MAVRGMHITYPTPEPVFTPRAREGLRAVVPTIFPPSTVNRGESMYVRPSDLSPNDYQRSSLRETDSDGYVQAPKKRGPKPKPRFVDGDCSQAPESHERRAEEEESPRPYKLSKFQGNEEMRLQKLARRHSENRAHRHHHHYYHHHHHHSQKVSGGSSYKQLHSHRSTEPHRTKGGSSYLAAAHFKHHHKASPSRPADLPQMEKPYFLDRPSPTRFDDERDETAWKPCLSNVEKVLVTDVTANFLTVTIKESSTSKGFFKDKRWSWKFMGYLSKAGFLYVMYKGKLHNIVHMCIDIYIKFGIYLIFWPNEMKSIFPEVSVNGTFPFQHGSSLYGAAKFDFFFLSTKID